MNKLILATALYAGLAACGDEAATTANDSAATTGEAAPAAATQTASAAFPRGARIVEENGVTFRIDPDGTRVQLGPNESRIIIEEGTRFRVDPDGTRVRIDPQGAAIEVDLPDVDIDINERGNPDRGDRDRDGGR